MKLSKIIESITNLKVKITFDGEFKVFNFYIEGEYIGHIHLRLKKGWNQLHIEIIPKYQGKGYSIDMIEYVIKEHSYICFPKNRILNEIIYKIIKKFKSNSKYDVWKTKYDEWVISNKEKSKDEINKILS